MEDAQASSTQSFALSKTSRSKSNNWGEIWQRNKISSCGHRSPIFNSSSQKSDGIWKIPGGDGKNRTLPIYFFTIFLEWRTPPLLFPAQKSKHLRCSLPDEMGLPQSRFNNYPWSSRTIPQHQKLRPLRSKEPQSAILPLQRIALALSARNGVISPRQRLQSKERSHRNLSRLGRTRCPRTRLRQIQATAQNSQKETPETTKKNQQKTFPECSRMEKRPRNNHHHWLDGTWRNQRPPISHSALRHSLPWRDRKIPKKLGQASSYQCPWIPKMVSPPS